MNSDEEDATVAKFLGLGVWAWGMIIVLLIGSAAAFAYVEPWFMSRDTANTRESLQYITTHQASLRQLKTAYDGLEARLADISSGPDQTGRGSVMAALQDQQRAIVAQMRQEADLIPNNVPPDIRTFLATH